MLCIFNRGRMPSVTKWFPAQRKAEATVLARFRFGERIMSNFSLFPAERSSLKWQLVLSLMGEYVVAENRRNNRPSVAIKTSLSVARHPSEMGVRDDNRACVFRCGARHNGASDGAVSCDNRVAVSWSFPSMSRTDFSASLLACQP